MAYTEDDVPAAMLARSRFIIGRNIDATVQEGEDAGDSLPTAKMVSVNENGSVYVAPDPGGFAVELPDPVPVSTEDRVVLTRETLYDTFAVRSYAIDYNASPIGVVLPTSGDIVSCEGFMLFAAPGNVGTIYVGDSAATCFIPLTEGTPKTYSLGDPQQVYAYSGNAGDSEADPVVPPGDTLIIEFYNPVLVP